MEHCPFCGTTATPPGRFCILCGRPLADIDPELAKALDAEALDRLRQEKRRLSLELRALETTTVGTRSWEEVRSAWQDITAELTAKLDAIAPRKPVDRRTTERRLGQERRREDGPYNEVERRSGLQRRRRERRTGKDRRASPEREEP
jgi:hypothetical protein